MNCYESGSPSIWKNFSVTFIDVKLTKLNKDLTKKLPTEQLCLGFSNLAGRLKCYGQSAAPLHQNFGVLMSPPLILVREQLLF